MKRCTVFAALLVLCLPWRGLLATELYLVESIATESTDAPSRAQARALESIYADLARESGVDARLIYSTDPDINAFASEVGDDKIVVVQEGLLAKLDDDRDAVAATLGHELAHHKADHIRAGRRKQEGVRVLGAILGAVVGARVGRNSGELAAAVSGAAVGVGAGLLALKFNRSQELEADRLAIGWMIAAGYSPNGMLRLQQRLGEMAGKRRAAILSTHPTSTRRYQSAEKLIGKLAPSQDLLARPAARLVDDAALAEATAEVQRMQEQSIAEALRPQAEEAVAVALAPIDGVSFETYAALGNQLLHAGNQGKAQVLKQHKLDEARLARLAEGFTARMQEHPSLARRYSVDFFRASQGRLAAYGRDLADSFEKGQPLKLDPPYSLETAHHLFAAMQARGAPSLDEAQQASAEAEILRVHGLTYYDYLIGHNWWSRKATVAALTGDTYLLQSYYGTQASGDDHAEAADVHIGKNVHVGDGVRFGSKSQARDEAAVGDRRDSDE